jgi:hypothetical protein
LQAESYQGSETLAILRAHLRTRKAINYKGLQRRKIGCAYRRRRAGKTFYRSESTPQPPPLSAALGSTCDRHSAASNERGHGGVLCFVRSRDIFRVGE